MRTRLSVARNQNFYHILLWFTRNDSIVVMVPRRKNHFLFVDLSILAGRDTIPVTSPILFE